MLLSCLEGHRLWAASYDDGSNPLLALESRLVARRLGPLAAVRFLDAAAGTGRWMAYAAAHGARVYGFDLCPEMLRVGAGKPGMEGRLALADAGHIPLRDGSIDLAVCSFALSYLPALAEPLKELARVARRVVLSDLHPVAAENGWTRGLRSQGRAYALAYHRYSERHVERCAQGAGLAARWRMDACFDEPEKLLFARADKLSVFESLRHVPAVWISEWERA